MRRRLSLLAVGALFVAALVPDTRSAVPQAASRPGGEPPAVGRVREARLELIGALRLTGASEHGDLAVRGSLAFVGSGRGACGSGADVVDLSDPSRPAKLATTEGHPNTSMEDVDVLRVGAREVLGVALQPCGDERGARGRTGLDLVDVSDPKAPRALAFFDTGGGGVHELDLTLTPGGKALALLAVPDLEVQSAGPEGRGGRGDLLIVDISAPERPALVGEWGVRDEAALGVEVWRAARRGSDARSLLHSVRANADGTRAYLSYWDAGLIVLDIRDPARPVFLGRAAYLPGEEGNAHSVAEAAGGALLVQADEDLTPFRLTFTSDAFVGERPLTEGLFTPRVGDLVGRALAGEVVHVGRGCPGASPDGAEDPYLADPARKIGLIERGECRFETKIARAQLAGAIGAIVYNNAADGDALVRMAGSRETRLPDGRSVSIAIPAIFVQRSAGLLLADATRPQARLAAEFDGWGTLRILDARDPSRLSRLGTFATPNALDETVASRGLWSVHNPEVVGDLVVASWYDDGVRVFDIGDPTRPREVAAWIGEGRPADAPPVRIWSAVPHGDFIVASDMRYGLYVLRMSVRRAPP